MNFKISILFTVMGFEHITFTTCVSSHNHKTRAYTPPFSTKVFTRELTSAKVVVELCHTGCQWVWVCDGE